MKIKVQYIEHDYSRLPEVTKELEVTPAKLALLLVDCQNDFLHEKGMFGAKGADVAAARRMIEPTRRVADACRKAGIKVFYTNNSFRPDLVDMGKAWAEVYLRKRAPIGPGDRVGPSGENTGYLVEGRWNTQFVDELTPQEGDIVISRKHTHSAFYYTDLDFILKNLGIELVMYTGITTGVCVGSSIRDGFHSQFVAILLNDCCWEFTPELQAATEMIVKMHFGYVTNSEEVIKGLTATA